MRKTFQYQVIIYLYLRLFKNKNLRIKFLDKYISIMRSGGDSTKILNFRKKYLKRILLSQKNFSNIHTLFILMKILSKLNQFKILKKKISNNYINALND